MLREFILSTAWPMTPPAAYGSFHLCFLLIGLPACALLAFLLRRCGERGMRAVLLCCGGFLALSELYKQLFYYWVIGGGSYQWWIFPFQLCSVPMYLCFAAALLPAGRVRDAMCDFMVSYNFLGGFAALLEPSGLVHPYVTLTWHAFVWHTMLVFLGLFLAANGRAGKRLSDFPRAVRLFGALAALAFALNLALRRVSGGAVNMFYIGPSNSPLIICKDICARYGWYVNTPIYLLALTLGAFLFFAAVCALRGRAARRRSARARTGAAA